MDSRAKEGDDTKDTRINSEIFKNVKECFKSTSAKGIAQMAIQMEESNRTHPYVSVLKALYNFKAGNFLDAHAHLLFYMREHKKMDLFALEAMAMWNLTVGRTELALDQYIRLLKFYSRDMTKKVEIMFNIAICKKDLGFYDFALEILERMLALPDGYKMLPRIYIQTFHVYLLKENTSHLKKLLKMFKFPGNNSFMNRLYAEVLFLEGSYDDLIELVNTTKYDSYLYYLAVRAGDFTEVAQEYYFEELLYYAENNYYMLNTYANYLMRKGFYPTAAQYYEMSLRLNPEYGPALKNYEYIQKISKVENGIRVFQPTEKVFVPVDIKPGVGKMGFFNTFVELNGFTCIVDKHAIEAMDTLNISSNE